MNSSQRHRRHERRERSRSEKRLASKGTILDFERNFSAGELFRCAVVCRRSVRWKSAVQRWMSMGWLNAVKLSDSILSGTYRKAETNEFTLRERGKPRLIKPVTFRDRVVERALCENVLIPLLEREMTYDNAASRKGKGTEFARDRFARAVARESVKNRDAYVLVYDFKDYFASVPTDMVMREVESRIMALAETEDEERDAIRTIELARLFICEKDGLELGNQTSQVCAVWWASPIDHWLSEVARVPNGRYMDDGWAIFPDRDSALDALEHVRDIAKGIGLTISEKKTYVAKLSEGVPFLKTVFKPNRNGGVSRRVASSCIRRWKRRERSVARLAKRGDVTKDDLLTSLASRNAITKRCDSKRRRRLRKRLDLLADELASDL